MEHNYSTGMRTGELVVTMYQDVVPGEVWYGRSTTVARIDPLNKPAFISMGIHTRKFFVPYRTLDPDYVDYWMGRSPEYTYPTIDIGFLNGTNSKVHQMFGLPTTLNRDNREVCAFPLMAYNKIWNDHFRQSEMNEVSLTYEGVHRVSHPTNQYFTKMRSDQQLGDPVAVDTTPELTIPSIRDGWAIQRLQEHRLLYGDKFTDQLKRFGVNAPAGLIDQAIPISAGKGIIGISEVVETATTATSNSGQMTGHGIVTFGNNLKPRKFLEPGIIMEVAYARPRLSLANNIPRIWLKDADDPTSEYQPETAVQSDAIVQSDEIHALQSVANTNFAYIDNYEWLRGANDVTAGGMLYTDYLPYTEFRTLQNVPTLSFLQQVDDYDKLYQNSASEYRSDFQLLNAHRIKKLSPVRKKGRN